MAKTDTATLAAEGPKRKKKAADAGGVEAKRPKPAKTIKPPKAAKPAKAKKAGKSDKAGKSEKVKGARSGDAMQGLSKFVDHPLVADLLAAGAMAAVAAIAEHKLGSDRAGGSSKVVKSAGKAAATAMGRKLMNDIGQVTSAATEAAKKA